MRRTVEIVPTPSITLRPAPPCEPPFDDELPPQHWATAHQLALDWPATEHLPRDPAPDPTPRPRPVTTSGASHDAKLAVHRFVRTCVEVLNGHRPPAQLRPLSHPPEAANVVSQAVIGSHRVAAMRKAHHAPGRRPPRRPPPVGVIRLRLCEPRPGAVEAAVALVTGERTWAMAFRLELHHDSWSATALRLI